MNSHPLIQCEELVKIYKVADLEVVALQGLNLEVEPNEIVALVGASGSGKSTLLNILGGFDKPSAGRVIVDQQDLLTLSQRQRTRYKQKSIGFIWQQPSRNLLPYLTAVENIALPMTGSKNKARAVELLEMVGLTDQAHLRPEQLSGGQQQQASLAVALANNPRLLLADEPTGQLDSDSVQRMFDTLHRINEQLGTTILLVTHDPTVAARVNRVISIRDGRTSTEIRRERTSQQSGEAEEEWVILDRTGRLQIPAVYVESLALKGRVRLRKEEHHLAVFPDVDSENLTDLPLKQWRPETTFDLNLKRHQEPPNQPAIQTAKLSRQFGEGALIVTAVSDVNLTIPHGKMVLLKGRSGSGKTTLLNLLGGLDDPSSGEVLFYNDSLTQLDDQEKIALRRQKISYIFQNFGLLPFLTAQENVEVAFRLLQLSFAEQQEQATHLLELVGLADRKHHRVYELSGGEQQRVGIARALAGRPWLLLADEPTGQLDTTTGSDIIALLRKVVDELNTTVVIASHDAKVAEAVDLVFEMKDGQITAQTQIERP